MYQGLPLSAAHEMQEHRAWRATVRRFVDKELLPNIDAWDEAEEFPRALYGRIAELGLLGMGFPEEYGGTPGDLFHLMIAVEELARTASGGLLASLFSHTIGAPPIVIGGSPELKARVLPQILSGKKISALAVTEPAGGSDVANLALRAERDGDHYVLNGSKTFITSGMRADYITVAARTGGPGASGVSALLVEGDTPGLTRTPLKKMGWWCSDTAQLHFDNCRVPLANLLGQENGGFFLFMSNFNRERLSLAWQAYAFSRVCLDEAAEWASTRTTFGKRLVGHQVVRHKLVAMATRIEATRALIEDMTLRIERGESPVAQICMLKNFAAQTMQFCADSAVQILGGMGYMRGTKSERIYREVKVNMIGGGAEEVLAELAARQLGWA
ncbi:acyl-CoA dehydrogenase family protein [Noviherbaspirillum sp.]|uniref:acyl-CoA dehydrogenase family protein n=1 Tax=Noviherbaspirillum sp. TaxID=1926288 RepID=UPI002B48D004|nr:acyl-CoA dehydrogenase family protein [Noviherbaspirillum sp.]HJV83404.1 acyl-CoA dehydrogenase family protein [Noviherbaspirillum sp.]